MSEQLRPSGTAPAARRQAALPRELLPARLLCTHFLTFSVIQPSRLRADVLGTPSKNKLTTAAAQHAQQRQRLFLDPAAGHAQR
ncbi:hypothetical protein [Azohydromonas lata]|uniref:Uncharacterized protein n=1 Tax=Azohydromonas lata TaxID=45677 RepID=A0ABU5IFV0_9BURK|nr:hypothetical protein [Azohydromonas lata]MDZ5457400.1 hypothetical protein [Azohydromonas lata]